MSVFNLLTIIFVTLKLTGIIDWDWSYVLLPTIILFAIYITMSIINLIVFKGLYKKGIK